MNPALRAFEHTPVPITALPTANSLGLDEVERLEAICLLRPGLCEFGRSTVRFAQYCGVLCIGERILEILPKTDRIDRSTADAAPAHDMLLRMLRVVHDLPSPPLGSGSHDLIRSPLIELFAGRFLAETMRLVKAGLLKSYVSRSENSPTVRGRIDWSRHLRANAGRQDRAWCEFDELTHDVAVNRVLVLALLHLRDWLVAPTSIRLWHELMAAFDGIAPARRDEIERLCLDRQSRRYAAALKWARWIIEGLSPSLRAGVATAPALLFDMNQLFERYVAIKLARQAPPGWVVECQHDDRHLARVLVGEQGSSPAYRLKPDLLVRRADRIVMIADTKWKRLERDRYGKIRPSTDDMYQLNAYATAFQECGELALIYPCFDGLAADTLETTMRYELAGSIGPRSRRVHVAAVDLMDDVLRVRVGSSGDVLRRLAA